MIAAETLAIDVERHLHNWEVDQLVVLVDNEVEECIDIPTQITIETKSDVEATECATKVNEVSSSQ